ncbi:hypothetical protein JG688_00010289 [Phytophthora aleatoria]|uniref:Uncharacterized protein n=1 Tax=Phytophthora aleatoria TaxID=2496075 RepID=A0A8J5M3F8_9STRA|nr:hypothetical protein JG688_00010289 [Phytophthora aleatoria]
MAKLDGTEREQVVALFKAHPKLKHDGGVDFVLKTFKKKISTTTISAIIRPKDRSEGKGQFPEIEYKVAEVVEAHAQRVGKSIDELIQVQDPILSNDVLAKTANAYLRDIKSVDRVSPSGWAKKSKGYTEATPTPDEDAVTTSTPAEDVEAINVPRTDENCDEPPRSQDDDEHDKGDREVSTQCFEQDFTFSSRSDLQDDQSDSAAQQATRIEPRDSDTKAKMRRLLRMVCNLEEKIEEERMRRKTEVKAVKTEIRGLELQIKIPFGAYVGAESLGDLPSLSIARGLPLTLARTIQYSRICLLRHQDTSPHSRPAPATGKKRKQFLEAWRR